jgi:hypothetical protein
VERVYNRSVKRINLMLDEPLIERLRREAESRGRSMSEVVRTSLARVLGLAHDPDEVLERIRGLRESLGRMPDSAAEIRASRDRGW